MHDEGGTKIGETVLLLESTIFPYIMKGFQFVLCIDTIIPCWRESISELCMCIITWYYSPFLLCMLSTFFPTASCFECCLETSMIL